MTPRAGERPPPQSSDDCMITRAMLTSLRRSPLVELAVGQLRAQVLAGTWELGGRLPAETELAEQLGVGRSTVREAVRALVHSGLLETRQGAGTFVVALSEQDALEPRLRRADLLHVYEVRAGLELQAARLAARRRTAGDLRRIDAAWKARQRALAASRDAAFVGADVAFHAAVIDATHNPLLIEMFASFARALRDGLERIVGDVELSGVDNTEAHAELVQAVRDRDGEAAVAATERLIAGTADAIRALLDAAAGTAQR
jgi:GntR family transcriptional regulator, transcriptional repressor for pyruvate dehydrogenase complex